MILTWHDTWHATSTCHIMPSWADTGTYRDHPGPLLETMPCIESSVIMCAFFPDDFMHAFSIACRKTSHNWLHMAPPSKQLRYMTDGVLLRETLFEPDLDRYCAWKPRDFMFPMKPILHSKTQTWLYKNSEQSHDFWGWWVSRHSRLVDSCWLHMTPYDSIWLHIWLLDSGVFAHKGSKGLPVRVTTRLSSWTKRTNDPSTPMCCLECFGGDWQFNYI